MLALSLILVGILLRFIPHAPNFTPVAAIAIFSGVYLDRRYALLVPLLLMIISDIFIGLHDVVAFTWGSFVLVTFLGIWVSRRKSVTTTLLASFISSFLFFVITNFGVWIMGWYPYTLKGLITCYIMAIPFLRNFTLATLCYTAAFFAAYELIARVTRDTKLAKVLLKK